MHVLLFHDAVRGANIPPVFTRKICGTQSNARSSYTFSSGSVSAPLPEDLSKKWIAIAIHFLDRSSAPA